MASAAQTDSFLLRQERCLRGGSITPWQEAGFAHDSITGPCRGMLTDPGEHGGRWRMLGGMLLLFGLWSPAPFFLEGSSKERRLRTAGKGSFSF